MKRLPKYLTATELEKLDTKRLLNYLKHLHKCEDSLAKSDKEEATSDNKIIEFKESEIWISTYKMVKSILNKREHINR